MSPKTKFSLQILPATLAFLILVSCALPGTVQRETVEYNTAAAGMANTLTLLNIIRAQEDLPIFYTSISRLSGSTVVTATGGFNAQIKAAAPTDATSTTNALASTKGDTLTTGSGTSTSLANAAAPSGTTTTNTAGTTTSLSDAAATSAVTTVTNVLSHSVTSGGNVYMPSVGGQVVSGPSFDINILDTQLFYQGVLGEVPFSTVDNYIDQDYDNQLLMWLLIDRLEFSLNGPSDSFKSPLGSIVETLHNVVSDDKGSTERNEKADEFADAIACLSLSGITQKVAAKSIAPLSRVTTGADGTAQPLKVQDLVLFDGQHLDIDGPIHISQGDDMNVLIIRPPTEKRVAKLSIQTSCYRPLRISDPPTAPVKTQGGLPENPPANPIYFDAGKAMVLGDDKRTGVEVPVAITATFRSPEGVIRFLGKYLRASETNPDHTYRLGTQPLFSVSKGSSSSSLVATDVLSKHYYIADDANRRRNMTVLALVEQLVNLQKSAADRPAAVPVHVVP